MGFRLGMFRSVHLVVVKLMFDWLEFLIEMVLFPVALIIIVAFTLRFVNHSRGDNARRVNFNRECWLMLIGYPPDYRSNEEIGDTIKSFGRLLFWQRDNIVARVIIKTRVTDLSDVPHYIIIFEGDGYEGVSLNHAAEYAGWNATR
jgi:hypothetical protein